MKYSVLYSLAMRTYKIIPQIVAAVIASIGSFAYGIILGWSAPAAPQMLDPNYKFPVSENDFAWVVAVMSIGGALALLVCGFIRSKLGTKKAILIFGLANLIGWILIIFASNVAMLIAGRFFLGLSGGCYSFNIPVYIGEMASKEIRGTLLIFFQVFIMLGIVFVYIIGSFTSLLATNIICGSIIIIYTTLFMFLPETPVYLMYINEPERARKSIIMLRGENYDASLEIDELRKHNDETKNLPKVSLREEFQRKATFKAFIIIFFTFNFFQMCGINAVIFYTTTIFIEAGVAEIINPSIATIILGFVQVLATLSSIATIDRYGRKIMLIISYALMILGLVGIGTYFQLLSNASSSMDNFRWLPLTSLCIFVIAFSIGLGPIAFVLLGEIFSENAKKFVAPFAQLMNFLISFTVGLTFLMLTSSIGSGPTFFMFAGWCVAGLIFTIIIIPETKGKSLLEIQKLLEQ